MFARPDLVLVDLLLGVLPAEGEVLAAGDAESPGADGTLLGRGQAVQLAATASAESGRLHGRDRHTSRTLAPVRSQTAMQTVTRSSEWCG